ncbi:endonuclease [[Mycoplasma] gypis]|uniref:Endonuclease n=1 Tax=[Mycoplasma] gypis TaxID=92404 RepID=A0ABZ2RQ42_9BACT|nr:endonuclease [[Mycoplasma] gypis]MBN0919514.1 endonuclease [[Mycoplasma] gypis]
MKEKTKKKIVSLFALSVGAVSSVAFLAASCQHTEEKTKDDKKSTQPAVLEKQNLTPFEQWSQSLDNIFELDNNKKQDLKEAIFNGKKLFYDRVNKTIIWVNGKLPNFQKETTNVLFRLKADVSLPNADYQFANNVSPTYTSKGYKKINSEISYRVENDKLILSYLGAQFIKRSAPKIASVSRQTEITIEGLSNELASRNKTKMPYHFITPPKTNKTTEGNAEPTQDTSTPTTPEVSLSEWASKLENKLIIIPGKEQDLKWAIENHKNLYFDYKTGNVIWSKKYLPDWSTEVAENSVLTLSEDAKRPSKQLELANDKKPTYSQTQILTRLNYVVNGEQVIISYKPVKFIFNNAPEISDKTYTTTLTIPGLVQVEKTKPTKPSTNQNFEEWAKNLNNAFELISGQENFLQEVIHSNKPLVFNYKTQTINNGKQEIFKFKDSINKTNKNFEIANPFSSINIVGNLITTIPYKVKDGKIILEYVGALYSNKGSKVSPEKSSSEITVEGLEGEATVGYDHKNPQEEFKQWLDTLSTNFLQVVDGSKELVIEAVKSHKNIFYDYKTQQLYFSDTQSAKILNSQDKKVKYIELSRDSLAKKQIWFDLANDSKVIAKTSKGSNILNNLLNYDVNGDTLTIHFKPVDYDNVIIGEATTTTLIIEGLSDNASTHSDEGSSNENVDTNSGDASSNTNTDNTGNTETTDSGDDSSNTNTDNTGSDTNNTATTNEGEGSQGTSGTPENTQPENTETTTPEDNKVYDNSDPYYVSLNGKSGQELITALETLERTNLSSIPKKINKDSINRAFEDNFYENDQSLIDIFSEKINGSEEDIQNPSKFNLVTGSFVGNSKAKILKPNDLHGFFYRNSNKYNSKKIGGLILGEVDTPTTTTDNGSKIANKVLEPSDDFKGDFARAFLYIALTYGDHFNGTNNLTQDFPHMSSEMIQTLVKWAKQDPVDKFDIQRNNVAYELTQQRNPFIDYPEFVKIFTQPNDLTFENKGILKGLK